MIKNLLFDIDGTLLDTKDAGLKALQKTLKDDYNINQTLDQLEFAFSATDKTTFNHYGIPEAEHEDAARSIMRNSFSFIDAVHPFTGIKEVLQYLLRNDFNLSIVTSETRQELNLVFMNTSIAKYFDTFVTADMVSKPKPDAEPADLALKLLKAKPEETLFIGDSYSDIGSAHGANTKFGLAGWGANPDDKFPNAEFIFKEPKDIEKATPTFS